VHDLFLLTAADTYSQVGCGQGGICSCAARVTYVAEFRCPDDDCIALRPLWIGEMKMVISMTILRAEEGPCF